MAVTVLARRAGPPASIARPRRSVPAQPGPGRSLAAPSNASGVARLHVPSKRTVALPTRAAADGGRAGYASGEGASPSGPVGSPAGILRPPRLPASAALLRAAVAGVALFAAGCLCPTAAWSSAGEKIMEASRGRLADWVLPFFLAMLPIVEVRGAVPIGIMALHMDPLQVFLLSVAGNMVPVPLLLLGLNPLAAWASARSHAMKRFFDYVFQRSRNQTASWKEHEFKAIALFVGVPLPGTGAWSGSIGCFVLGMPFWKSMLAIFIGVVIATAAMTGLTLAGQWGITALR